MQTLKVVLSSFIKWRVPTVKVTLFLRGHDGHQMGPQYTTVLLCNLPAQTLAEVSITETMELVPSWFTLLQVWKNYRGRERWKHYENNFR